MPEASTPTKARKGRAPRVTSPGPTQEELAAEVEKLKAQLAAKEAEEEYEEDGYYAGNEDDSPEIPEVFKATPGQQVPGSFQAVADTQKAAQEAMLEAVKHVVTTWDGRIHEQYDFEVPSGQTCRVRAITTEDAIALGVLDSVDMFTPELMGAVIEAENNSKETDDDRNQKALDSLKDPEKRAKFFGLINKITVHAVVIPKIVPQTNDDGTLNAGEVFVGDIPFADKMAIFRKVMGISDGVMSTFREGS